MTRVIATTTMLHMATIFHLNTFGHLFGKTISALEKIIIFVIVNLLEITVYPYLLKGPLP